MARYHNFSPGPSILPEAVLLQAKEELLDWRGRGVSVMEISHRSEDFLGIAREAEADFRQLLNLNDDYAVLFLQGGASLQFSAVALNLSQPADRADYACTGAWSAKAIQEASRLLTVNKAVNTAPNHTSIPPLAEWQLDPKAAYLHYTSNETIHGVEFDWIPQTQAPLVVDMSSNILSQPLDVSRFGVIYAGAQKNLGPAGLTVVVVRKDLLGRARQDIPRLLNWEVMAASGSMDNTPPTFNWYLAGLVFKWIQAEGGLTAMAERNRRKSQKVYQCIDDSGFYISPVDVYCRSKMNIPFVLANPELESVFLKQARLENLLYLKGHRAVGGIRASLYNALPEASVDVLVAFMRHFEATRG